MLLRKSQGRENTFTELYHKKNPHRSVPSCSRVNCTDLLRHVKRIVLTLIGEIKIKTIMRCHHLSPVPMAVTQNLSE